MKILPSLYSLSLPFLYFLYFVFFFLPCSFFFLSIPHPISQIPYNSRLDPNRDMTFFHQQQPIRNKANVSLAVVQHLSSADANGSNLVFSPLSLHVAVSQVAAGASGQTLRQLLFFLESKSTDEVNELCSELVSVVLTDASGGGGPKLSFINGVWIQMDLPLKPSFRHVVENVYKSTPFQVDFFTKAEEIRSEVNSWAEKETNGLIKNILPPGSVDDKTRLIFTNALYFKGAWSQKFDASKTQDHDFHLLGGNSVKVPFMTSNKNQFINTFNGFKVLRLPYKQGDDRRRQFSMYILLPDSKDGLSTLVERVGSDIGFLDRHLCVNEEVDVNEFRLPRFKISFEFEASKALEKLGVQLPFIPGGLTEMVDLPLVGRKLYVSEIYHKSCIEVNEEGSEAAAVSVVVVMQECARVPSKVDFVADHPFMFLIREDNTGSMLFYGHVLNPV